MEFSALDDDLFCEKRQRNNPDEDYTARFCENCWFLHASNDLLVSEEDKLSVLKHSADYLFFTKDFNSALVKYEDILNSLPASNTTVRRECYEGILRSCIKLGSFEKAFRYAEKLHSTSKTTEQTTVSCSALIDAGIAAREYAAALKAAQLLVMLHPFNADAWLKLAHCYAGVYEILLPSMKGHSKRLSDKGNLQNKGNIDSFKIGVNESTVSDTSDSQCTEKKLSRCKTDEMLLFLNSDSEMSNPQCSLVCIKETMKDSEPKLDNLNDSWKEIPHDQLKFTQMEKGAQFVCGSLYRSYTMLKRTEGTTFGFALDSSLDWQKTLWCDMKSVLDKKSLSFVIYEVNQCDNIYSSSSPLKDCSSEFIDRGSSKFKSDESEMSVLDISQNSFESQWFKWMK